jgi:hypothetical protein
MDIQAIKDAAVTAMLKFGEYPNTVLLHGRRGYMSVQIPFIDPSSKYEVMAIAGKHLGHTLGREIHYISNIALITEAWMSRHPVGTLKRTIPVPSQDINRAEVLLIAAMALPSRSLQTLVLEIKRHGDLMELVEDTEWQVSKSDLLDAFVDGLLERVK